MSRIHFLFYFLSMNILPFVLTAQEDTRGIVDALRKAGMENVSCMDADSVYIVTAEDNTYRLRPDGLLEIINRLQPCHKPVRLIMLDNNVPQLLLSSGASCPDSVQEWSAGYRTDPYRKALAGSVRDNSSLFKFDFVLYPELKFRNIKLDRMYDWVVNISPALEFSAWKGMKFTGQVIFPLVNQYGEQYKQIRPGFVTVSQQIRFRRQWFVRATVGVFSNDRWGVDVKAFHPFKNERFALRMQAGLTGASSFWNWNWYYSNPGRFTGNIGGQYYHPRHQVQCVLTVGRYLAGDYGVRADMMRHFRYTTVGFYGLKTNKSTWNGGFYFTVALPPYKQKRKRVRVTTANYFNLEYNAKADTYYGQTYKTSPGENASQWNFNPYFIYP